MCTSVNPNTNPLGLMNFLISCTNFGYRLSISYLAFINFWYWSISTNLSFHKYDKIFASSVLGELQCANTDLPLIFDLLLQYWYYSINSKNKHGCITIFWSHYFVCMATWVFNRYSSCISWDNQAERALISANQAIEYIQKK